MALVITDGRSFIYLTDTNQVRKTTDASRACNFRTKYQAICILNKAPKKTAGCYVYDTDTNKICWSRQKRKQYPKSVREKIFIEAEGCCQLCGDRIPYDQMTLDHITPISMGGSDCMENLQCTCGACNRFKNNILPELFMDKIMKIFVYQMDKKYNGRLCWKCIRTLLSRLINK